MSLKKLLAATAISAASLIYAQPAQASEDPRSFGVGIDEYTEEFEPLFQERDLYKTLNKIYKGGLDIKRKELSPKKRNLFEILNNPSSSLSSANKRISLDDSTEPGRTIKDDFSLGMSENDHWYFNPLIDEHTEPNPLILAYEEGKRKAYHDYMLTAIGGTLLLAGLNYGRKKLGIEIPKFLGHK